MQRFTTVLILSPLKVFLFLLQNKDARTNETMLRETAAIFLMAYFFPGCQDENSLPDSKMVRSGMTTVMHTNDNEDLENTVIHAFTEEEDWVFDVCCGSRELSLAGTIFSPFENHFVLF